MLASEPAKVCPACGGANASGARQCFLCGQDLAAASEVRASSHRAEGQAAIRWSVMSAITLSLVALLVGAGIFLESPGVGIALAAIVVPLVAAVLLLGPAQSQQHIPASGGWISQALSVILAMTGLVVLVGGMLVAAAAVALFVFCSSFRL